MINMLTVVTREPLNGDFLIDYIYIYVPILSWMAAQLIKGFISWEKNEKFNIHSFFASGGMPSSHTSFVTALIVTIGYTKGTHTIVFAIALALGIVVSYDAFNVRLHAGRGITMSKSIINTLSQRGIEVKVKNQKIKEVLGHRKIEVGGGIVLGLAVALLICNLVWK